MATINARTYKLPSTPLIPNSPYPLIHYPGLLANLVSNPSFKTSDEVKKKREELRGEADAFVAREHWANAKRLTIVKAQRIAKGIEETYNGDQYKELPKTAGKSIQEWLGKATPRR